MLKRIVDLLGSICGLSLLSPVLILFGFLVVVFHGRPILFTQQRGGLNGSVFLMYKFRTMTSKVDESGQLLPDADRITRFGTFMRDYSVDELPGLYCVLKGDMSLVGPRPLLVDYLPLYNKSQARRHEVKPGITGWAQINGRNAISWEEKFRLDVWYVDNHSVFLDFKIIISTIFGLLSRKDIVSEGEVSGARFLGNQTDRK